MWITELEPDVVVHCAADTMVGESVADPAKYYWNNISKTETLMTHLKDLKRKPLVLFSSSASVYGNPIGGQAVVETDLKLPISPYGVSKHMVERMLSDYFDAYQMPSVSFRYFNAAGAGVADQIDLGQAAGASHIIARILEAKLANKTFTLNGTDYATPDGTCIRDYVHVWDIAQAHLQAIDWVFNKGNYHAAAMNLGTGTGISNQEIINYVRERHGDFLVDTGPRRSGDPDRLVARADVAKATIGWTPEHSTLEQIVDSAWKWYNHV
jgi:UDP-glucose 4-epimerase